MNSRRYLIKALLLTLAAVSLSACAQDREEKDRQEMKFQRVPMQYIAALGAEDATSGSGAQAWGLWRVDPGPRGVRLKDYDKLQSEGGRAPAG
jgi:hypothetical protein